MLVPRIELLLRLPSLRSSVKLRPRMLTIFSVCSRFSSTAAYSGIALSSEADVLLLCSSPSASTPFFENESKRTMEIWVSSSEADASTRLPSDPLSLLIVVELTISMSPSPSASRSCHK